MYQLLADLVLIIHLAFAAFVLCGGLLVLKRRWVVWLHLPAMVWGAYVEFSGWICPLTPLENWLRTEGGGSGYKGDFLEHYLLVFLYPEGLTRPIQIALGLAVLSLNLAIYGWLWWRRATNAVKAE